MVLRKPKCIYCGDTGRRSDCRGNVFVCPFDGCAAADSVRASDAASEELVAEVLRGAAKGVR